MCENYNDEKFNYWMYILRMPRNCFIAFILKFLLRLSWHLKLKLSIYSSEQSCGTENIADIYDTGILTFWYFSGLFQQKLDVNIE